MALAEIDTPALLIDLDALMRNASTVHAALQSAGVAVRPHVKAHKSVDIAAIQQQFGMSGLCCQKVGEAEVFVDAGFRDVLVTNEVVGARKWARLAALARRARVGVCVDHVEQIDGIGTAAKHAGVTLDILIEIDIGHGRCGVSSPEDALRLARRIDAHAPGLSLRGLQAFRGPAQHMRQPAERQAAVDQACGQLRQILAHMAAEGRTGLAVSGGGTGTYAMEGQSGLYTEVQPGSYVLMDTDYGANILGRDEPALAPVLTALCTVISVQPGHAVLDGGLKAFAVDQGLPRLLLDGWQVRSISDEHLVIVPIADDAPALQLGQKLSLQPSHCDPTVNLHDWLVIHRHAAVHAVWPVSARGALF